MCARSSADVRVRRCCHAGYFMMLQTASAALQFVGTSGRVATLPCAAGGSGKRCSRSHVCGPHWRRMPRWSAHK